MKQTMLEHSQQTANSSKLKYSHHTMSIAITNVYYAMHFIVSLNLLYATMIEENDSRKHCSVL